MLPAPSVVGQPEAPAKAGAGRFHRLSRIFGSLQMAVILLPTFAGVLALGTLVESAHDSKAAHQLVYETWWFVALLALLGLNIFCAAMKKRPWKRQQTGFLITHVGLLTLVSGGLVTSLAGVHGVMTLVDSDDSRFVRHGPPASNVILDPQRDLIRVRRPVVNPGETQVRVFEPGPLPWNPSEFADSPQPTLAVGLNWLVQPWPRSCAMDLGHGARLEVLDYFPHALQQPFKPATASEPAAFPALAVELVSPTTGVLPASWLGFHGDQRTFRPGPGLIELLARNLRAEQLAEFQHPPTAGQVGKNGTLVVGLAGQTFRWDVERLLGKEPEPLGKTGWSLRIKQYMPNYRTVGQTLLSAGAPTDPGLALELIPVGPASRAGPVPLGSRHLPDTRPEGKIGLAVVARQAGEIFPMGKDAIPWQSLPGLWTWYHPPDFRYGDPSVKAVLQLVPAANGAIHYRSFASAKTGAFQFEKTGTTSQGAPRERIWAGMGWKFQVPTYLPHALPGPHYTPVERRAGQEDMETVPVIRCRLTQGTSAKEFWLAKSDDGFTPIPFHGEEFLVGFNTSQVVLDFALRLVRAEQTTDVGTSLPASQTSFVLLTDPGQKIHGEGRTITLNQPLSHGGYKFYQIGYKSLGMDAEGKPISRSVLKVQRDPGLWLKYAGSTMVALGIACMFYMKAYFFKRGEG